jgi:hypothetical protein
MTNGQVGAAVDSTERKRQSGKGLTPRVTRRLHSGVYGLLVGLALWLVMSVWLFAGPGTTNYLLFVVSAFIFIAVALPSILSRVGPIEPAGDRLSFREWAKSDFDTWQGRVSGAEAAVQVLLPISAVAFGMTAFGIALYIAER